MLNQPHFLTYCDLHVILFQEGGTLNQGPSGTHNITTESSVSWPVINIA